MVVELYSTGAVPTSSGFNPAAAVKRFAPVSGIAFGGAEYQPLITKGGTGDIKRTLRKELSSFSFTLDNSTREIYEFERDVNFEGLICVARLIDRKVSIEFADSVVCFTGRCKPPDTFDKASASVSITVEQILAGTEINVPRRTFAPDDMEGRAVSDYEFEGFRYQARSGTVVYYETVKKRFLLFFSKKKTESRTLQYSSRSDLDSTRAVPLALGRVQMQGIHIAGADTGSSFAGTAAFCDGHEFGIGGYENTRSVTPGVYLIDTNKKRGLKGGANPPDTSDTQTNDDPAWIGAGIYSRTAYMRYSAGGTSPQNDDPLPDVVSVILGVKVPVPDAVGVFGAAAVSDNPVVLARWFINSKYYFNLPAVWFDDAENYTESRYCDHVLVDQANTDVVQLNASESVFAGTGYFNYQSTGAVSPAFWQN